MGFMWRAGPGPDGIAQADRLMEMAITGLRPRLAARPQS